MQKILILDFGGQYNQLIARRVREHHVYCEVLPHDTPLAAIRAFDPIGIIFTGGPSSVYAPGAPSVDPAVFTLGLPILGICYGCQLLAQALGGRVTAAQDDAAREYGKTRTFFDPSCPLFRGLPEESVTWMSHGDYMAAVPEGFRLAARSAACPTVGFCDESRGFYGVQFHPEIRLILVLPCCNQTRGWKEADIAEYERIMKAADKVTYTSEQYYSGCMHKRNRHLVDNSSLCICYLTEPSGGTAYTVNYARTQGLKIINVAE